MCECVCVRCVQEISFFMHEWTDESTGVFSRVCVCARMCVCGLQVFFCYCWVISPNDERGAPYMEMGILLFLFCFEL